MIYKILFENGDSLKVRNFLTIIVANIRMTYKHTIIPSVVLLFIIPSVYGTANLDYLKSADCLERMVALIGIPMFTALVRQEHSRSLYEMVAFRHFSMRFIVILQIGLSIMCTLLLIFAFEVYMYIFGCSFPLFSYAFRTLALSMTLGFVGLFLSTVTQNTIGGYLGVFCFYFIVQTKDFAGLFQAVTNGVDFMLVVFLVGISLGIVCFNKPHF